MLVLYEVKLNLVVLLSHLDANRGLIRIRLFRIRPRGVSRPTRRSGSPFTTPARLADSRRTNGARIARRDGISSQSRIKAWALMKFYMAPGSCSTGIHILLEEIGLVFEAYIVNLPKGEHLTP